MVLASHLRRLGATQKQAAQAVGRAERTIRDWETNAELWEEARQEALELWGVEVDDAARREILRDIRAGGTDSAWKWLERTDPKLLPPKQRVEGEHFHLGAQIVVVGPGPAPPPDFVDPTAEDPE